MCNEGKSKKNVHFATIGTNFIVENFLNSAKTCEEFNAKVLYSREKERADRLGKNCKLSGYAVCDSLDELKTNVDIDAVYVASPTFLHCSQTVDMLNGGKNVFCEKPAASNYKEWQQMLDAAKVSGNLLIEAMRPIFTPGFAVIRDNLNKLGKIRKVFLQYCQYSSRYDKFKNGIIENAFRPEMSNGALMDLGIYCIEFMVALFGKPLSVTGKSVILPDSIDGEGTIIAEYPGMQAIISYSKISDSGMCCEIQGENGAICWNTVGCPQNITLKLRKQEEKVLFTKLERPDMCYEIEKYMYMLSDRKEAEAYNDITTESLIITDEIRKQCGIVFPADK